MRSESRFYYYLYNILIEEPPENDYMYNNNGNSIFTCSLTTKIQKYRKREKYEKNETTDHSI